MFYRTLLSQGIKMFKKIIGICSVTMLMLSFSGCGTAPVVKQLPKIENKVVSFNFPKIDPATGKKSVIRYNDLSKEIIKLSKYKVFSLKSAFGMHNGEGVKIDFNSNYFKILYLKGEVPVDRLSDKTYLSQVIFTINYSVDIEQVIFSFPDSYEYVKSSHPFGMSAKTLDTYSNLESDANKIFNNLDKMFITVNKTYKLTGEINSKYEAKSIYSNFKRIIGEYSWRDNEKIAESKKSNTFNLNFQGKDLPLYVEVYPYRDGSKAKYSVKIPYTLNSNAKGTLSKKEIENIKIKIEKIIND